MTSTHSNRGTTLIEVLAAVALMSTVIVVTIGALADQKHFLAEAREREAAFKQLDDLLWQFTTDGTLQSEGTGSTKLEGWTWRVTHSDTTVGGSSSVVARVEIIDEREDETRILAWCELLVVLQEDDPDVAEIPE